MSAWAVIPAAGAGVRFGDTGAKQYAELAGRPMLAHVLELFFSASAIDGVALAVAADDAQWCTLVPGEPAKPLVVATGGASRAESVLAALAVISARVAGDDWVLVHDAARPCLDPADLDALINALATDPVGGILAAPVADTLKREDAEGRVAGTVARDGLWRALTPQMFRYGLLCSALEAALAAAVEITDESVAMEHAGHTPRLVAGGAGNIKVTRREDLPIAEAILRSRRMVESPP